MGNELTTPYIQAQFKVPPRRQPHPLAPGSAKLRHSHILAEILDVALQKDTTLSSLLQEDPGLNLKGALDKLPAASKRSLHRHLSDGDLQKFVSLSEEADPEVFFRGLKNLALDLEDNDDLRFAFRADTTLAVQQTRFPDIRKQAKERLDVMSGKWSNVGDQLTFMGKQWVNESFKNLPMLAGMVAGTSAFRFGRFAAARRLAPAVEGAEAVAELKWGQRLLANGVGMASEVSAFTGARWGVQMLQGREPDTGLGAFFEQIEQGAFLLVPMRLAGAGLGWLSGSTVKYGLAKIPLLGRPFRNATVQKGFQIVGSQLGMELGILYGLSRQDPETGLAKGWYYNLTLSQSLALLTQRNLAQGGLNFLFRKKFPSEAKLLGR